MAVQGAQRRPRQHQGTPSDRKLRRLRQCHPGIVDGRRGGGQFGASGHADGYGRRRDGAVPELPEVRSGRPQMGGSRPFRALGRARLDAALFDAVPHRLCPADAAGHPQFPPGRQPLCRAPREFRAAGRGMHHRPARPGLCHGGRHGRCRAPSERHPWRRPGRSPHLGDRGRRLPDGRHQSRGGRPGRASEARQADRAVGRQQDHDRRRGLALVERGHPRALPRLGLAGRRVRRP